MPQNKIFMSNFKMRKFLKDKMTNFKMTKGQYNIKCLMAKFSGPVQPCQTQFNIRNFKPYFKLKIGIMLHSYEPEHHSKKFYTNTLAYSD
jgi:hypothetical protein